MNSTKLKVIAASAGAGAVLAMGALTVATTSSAEPSTPGPVPTAEATLGQSSVDSPAPESPSTSSAAPEIVGPAPLPPEEEGLPG